MGQMECCEQTYHNDRDLTLKFQVFFIIKSESPCIITSRIRIRKFARIGQDYWSKYSTDSRAIPKRRLIPQENTWIKLSSQGQAWTTTYFCWLTQMNTECKTPHLYKEAFNSMDISVSRKQASYTSASGR